MLDSLCSLPRMEYWIFIGPPQKGILVGFFIGFFPCVWLFYGYLKKWILVITMDWKNMKTCIDLIKKCWEVLCWKILDSIMILIDSNRSLIRTVNRKLENSDSCNFILPILFIDSYIINVQCNVIQKDIQRKYFYQNSILFSVMVWEHSLPGLASATFWIAVVFFWSIATSFSCTNKPAKQLGIQSRYHGKG